MKNKKFKNKLLISNLNQNKFRKTFSLKFKTSNISPDKTLFNNNLYNNNNNNDEILKKKIDIYKILNNNTNSNIKNNFLNFSNTILTINNNNNNIFNSNINSNKKHINILSNNLNFLTSPIFKNKKKIRSTKKLLISNNNTNNQINNNYSHRENSKKNINNIYNNINNNNNDNKANKKNIFKLFQRNKTKSNDFHDNNNNNHKNEKNLIKMSITSPITNKHSRINSIDKKIHLNFINNNFNYNNYKLLNKGSILSNLALLNNNNSLNNNNNSLNNNNHHKNSYSLSSRTSIYNINKSTSQKNSLTNKINNILIVNNNNNKYNKNNSSNNNLNNYYTEEEYQKKFLIFNKINLTENNNNKSNIINNSINNSTNNNKIIKNKKNNNNKNNNNNNNIFNIKNSIINTNFTHSPSLSLDFLIPQNKTISKFNENPNNNNTNLNDLNNINNNSNNNNTYSILSKNLSDYIKSYYDSHNNTYPSTNLNFYKIGRVIGKGAFGKVNLGLHILSGRLVAIKSFNKKDLNNKNREKINFEINLMKKINNNNNIVKFLENFETKNYIFIIMENISGGDLLKYIKKRNKLNEKLTKFIFKKIINGIKYLHCSGIIHRDIKLDNILLDINNNIKICDFGVSKIISNENEILYEKCGTPAFIAPEILNNDNNNNLNENGYKGFPVDIWSSGVVLYSMLSGSVPFKANNLQELESKIKKGNFKEIPNLSSECQDILHRLLKVNVNERIKIDEIINHPWLKNYDCFNNNNECNLFTKAENLILSKENIDYRNCKKEDEKIENFTIKNLYTINDINNKDIKTKSIILAPFNTSLENGKDYQKYYNKELKIDNNILEFNENVKVLNRQYELNYNGEIDHGILIKNSIDSNSLENNIKNNKIENNKIDYYNNNKNFEEDEIKNYNKNNLSNNNSIKIKSNKLSNNFSPKNETKEEDSNKNLSTLTNSSTLKLDEFVLKIIENLGYKKEYIEKCLINNEFNYATTTYYLLYNKNINNNNIK